MPFSVEILIVRRTKRLIWDNLIDRRLVLRRFKSWRLKCDLTPSSRRKMSFNSIERAFLPVGLVFDCWI